MQCPCGKILICPGGFRFDLMTTKPKLVNSSLAIIFLLLCLAVIASSLAYSGGEWIKYEDNPIFSTSEEGWDESYIHAVSVLKEGDSYRLWYSAGDGHNSGIGICESGDGINWERYSGNPLILNGSETYDSGYIFAPSVLRTEHGYMMWYTGSDADYIWTINLATSDDGINWERYPENPVVEPGPEWYDSERVGDPWVILDEGVYKMWYTCQSRPHIIYGIAYATSDNGIHWQKHPDPVLLPAESGPDSSTVRSPSVIKTESGYALFYRGIDTDGNWTICSATSADGINWQRNPDNPIIRSAPGSWDEKVGFPRAFVDDERYSLWYTSHDSSAVGYAYQSIPEAFLAFTLFLLVFAFRPYSKSGKQN